MRRARRHPATGPLRSAAAAAVVAAVLCLAAFPGPGAALVVEFPGPVPVEFLGATQCAVSVDFPDLSDRLVVGTATGDLAMVRFNTVSGVFSYVKRINFAGEVVALLPLRDAGGSVTSLLAATRNPDRIVTVRVERADPFLTAAAFLDLEEDPGDLALAAAGQAVVSLPGIDRLAWLVEDGGVWRVAGHSDAGDRPDALAAGDLDGDGTAEVVVANAGVLSRSLMVFRRGPAGYERAENLVLPGAPTGLAAGDLDGDGRAELAAVSTDTSVVWLLGGTGGALTVTGRLDLTVAADAVHLAPLPGGTWGLYPSSSSRGLLEYYRNDGGTWARRDGYYPGCRPLQVLTGDVNGDTVPDLVSVGGTTRVVTVMFGSPDLDYWGFPALALPGRPGGLSLGDFDGNGLNDVVVMAADRGTVGFFRGRSDGGVVISPDVQELFLVPGPMAAVAADARPGPELAVHDRLASRVRVLTHDGTAFAELASTPLVADARKMTAADVDADGREDLLVLKGTAPEVVVLFGAGDGTFPASVPFGFENRATDVVAVDLNADGRLDLVGVDGVNRVWFALNQGGRSFLPGTWINAGSGTRVLALGDLDGDLDEDVVVAGLTDETLTFLENVGDGELYRRVGSQALEARPEGVLVEDVNQDGINDVIVNLREAGTIGVVYGLAGWAFTTPVTFVAGGDVAFFATDDFNTDLVPDILTLDASLHLGLTMLNVERGIVPVEPTALAAECDGAVLTVTIRPDGAGPWRLDLNERGRVRTLASEAGAREGRLEADGRAWIWSGGAPGGGGAELSLVGRDGARAAVLALPDGGCGATDLRPAAWTREPWPNPFNPVVDARFTLRRPAEVTAAVYDLRGRLVAVLRRGALPAGEHDLRWDGTRGGRPAEAGVYLLRVSGGEFLLTGKLLLLK